MPFGPTPATVQVFFRRPVRLELHTHARPGEIPTILDHVNFLPPLPSGYFGAAHIWLETVHATAMAGNRRTPPAVRSNHRRHLQETWESFYFDLMNTFHNFFPFAIAH